MADDPRSDSNTRRVVTIVTSYIAHQSVAPDDLAGLIASVDKALRGLEEPVGLAAEARMPAVPVRRSVQRDYVVCLECGLRGKVIRRHLQARHGLSPDDYRARWSLAPDYPLVAPAYSERRSSMAKQIGLGRLRGQPMAGGD